MVYLFKKVHKFGKTNYIHLAELILGPEEGEILFLIISRNCWKKGNFALKIAFGIFGSYIAVQSDDC